MKNYALITGPTSGIGYELSKLLAKDAHNLVLVARNEQKLHKIKDTFLKEYPIEIIAIKKDLSEPNAAKDIYNELKNKQINVNILINNAGLGGFGFFYKTQWEREAQMIQLNICALTHLTKLFLPEMIEQKNGKIMNVSSIAAFMPGPLMGVYYATKSYVQSFSLALANELKGTGVSVTALCPGPTKTDFEKNALLEESKAFNILPVANAESVAKYGYKAMMKGKTTAIYGFFNKIIVKSVNIAPRSWVVSIVRKVQDKSK